MRRICFRFASGLKPYAQTYFYNAIVAGIWKAFDVPTF